jgi:hypothetical protein
LLTVALMLALTLSLGLQSKTVRRLTGVLLLFTGASGIFLYGYGYTKLFGSVLQALIRTLFSVFCMFLGRNEIGAISAVPELAAPGMQVYIYAVHLLALYCTASAVIATLGTRLVRSLRLLLARRGDLHVIYGVNAQTVAFAEKLRKAEKGFILFVSPGSGSAFEGAILRLGALMIDTDDAKKPTTAFLRKIGMRPGSRRLMLYCLDDSDTKNLQYAEAMKETLAAAEIAPSQTSLTVLLAEAGVGAVLQASDEVYGYGSVTAFERTELLARMMIRTWAPWQTIRFDEKARAGEDFEVLIIGFGATGQTVLRSLVMNGQFEGSHFRAAVISEDRSRRAGSFFSRYAALCEKYDITFHDMNARSIEAYGIISERFKHINYVAVCTGSEKENAEIAMELSYFFRARGVHPVIVQCSEKEISRISDTDGLLTTVNMYSPEILCGRKLDLMAMQLNHCYHEQEGKTAEEDWAGCDYFSRMSCRAAADYVDVFLHAAGTDRETVLAEGFAPSEEVMDTLSRTEHLRWCAFHFAMGYDTMPEETFEERAAIFRKQQAETGKGRIRIGKDADARLHACLIPWEELPALAEREFAVTGRRADYFKIDRDNVRLAVDMLRAANGE